jgi:mannitol/fructose-specific phosphotransferase system IIA component (Ntr-type)
MRIGEILRDDCVLTNFSGKDKWETISRLVDHLSQAHALSNSLRTFIREGILARERLATTGLEHGIALPHATLEGVDHPLVLLALAPAGIPFESVDSQVARIIILLVVPKRGVQRQARTLAAIARLLESSGMRDALLAARSAAEVLTIIRKEEAPTPAPLSQ